MKKIRRFARISVELQVIRDLTSGLSYERKESLKKISQANYFYAEGAAE